MWRNLVAEAGLEQSEFRRKAARAVSAVTAYQASNGLLVIRRIAVNSAGLTAASNAPCTIRRFRPRSSPLRSR
jgi:hypothetical protein